ncbi:MAG: hypothetical protein EOP28_00350 [Rhodococcus sp. (in: high G+C Gram-positive bacteria)]|nr:MAG: hypothetical protein EOP28_00350 [Rhodococcus sp. (in: high G+C Gram-positive bacteria)]
MKFVRPDNRNAREPLTASPSRPGLGNHCDWRARQDGWTRRELLAFSLSLFTQELGVPVLPDWGVRDLNVCECREKGACKNIGKHPALKHVTDATTNLEDAYEWWRKWDHNFAAIPVGYVVIDIDHGNVGLNEFFDWCLVNGLNPERMITETLLYKAVQVDGTCGIDGQPATHHWHPTIIGSHMWTSRRPISARASQLYRVACTDR